MREFGDVQPARGQLPGHRRQVRQQVVEREQVAQRVEHGDGEVEFAGEAEVPHVGFDHGQPDSGRRGHGPGPRAHRRG
jgi:hypothetical protein